MCNEGGKGILLFNTHNLGYDLLTAKLLQYFDLCVAHTPKGFEATALGLNTNIISSLAEHGTKENINAVEALCVIWGNKKQPGASSEDEDDLNPLKSLYAPLKGKEGAAGCSRCSTM